MQAERLTTSHPCTCQRCKQHFPLAGSSVNDQAHFVWLKYRCSLNEPSGKRRFHSRHTFGPDTHLIRQAWTQFSDTYPREFRLLAECELHNA
jgi:hypothetical protein